MDDDSSDQSRPDHRFQQAYQIAKIIAQAVNIIVDYFESELGMEVSASKSKVTATLPAIARASAAMITKGKATAIEYGKGETAKMLGVSTNGGATRTVASLRKRSAALKKKIGRYHILGKEGFSRKALARPTVVAAATYGCENTGYADSALRQLRTLALRTVATATSGGNLDAEWMARDGQKDTLDPAFAAHAMPICSLAEAWWCKWRQEEKLRDAHDAVMKRLYKPLKGNSSVWARAKGPTAAAILSASRIGWVFESADRVITDDGRKLELGVDSPADIKCAVEDSVKRWRTANVLHQFTAFDGLLKPQLDVTPPGVVPCMKRQWRRAAAAATLHAHKGNFDVPLGSRRGKTPPGWKPKYAAHLLSAVSNKQWPQARVAATRHAEWNTTAAWQLCYDPKGTLAHRHVCPRVLQSEPKPLPTM